MARADLATAVREADEVRRQGEGDAQAARAAAAEAARLKEELTAMRSSHQVRCLRAAHARRDRAAALLACECL